MFRLIGKAIALFTYLTMGLATPVAAQIPSTIHYQGILTDACGVPVTSQVSMTLSLYDVPAMGMPWWSELQTVQVANGLFAVQLGAGMPIVGGPLAGLPFDRPYYLEVAVNGETLSPRQAALSAPYARRAAVADSVDPNSLLVVGTNNAASCVPGTAGAMRWNTAISQLQMCDGAAWRSITVGPQTFTVGGSVMGATGPLILSNNGSTIQVSGDGQFAFPTPFPAGAPYSVSVFGSPTGQVCAVTNATGNVGMSNVTNVLVTCSTPQPLLRYAFEGDGNNTGSLAGLNLTLTSASFVAGKVGTAVSFAAGGYGQVLSGIKAAIGNNAQITVAFWMNEQVTLTGQAFFDVRNASVAPYGGVQLGQTGSSIGVCVSTTTNTFLSGSCLGFAAPSSNAWHHWIVRYAGTGTGPGQGGPTEIYVDNVLVLSRANDANNNPVFTSTGIPDTMYVGAPNVLVDQFMIFNRTFSLSEQCTLLIGGTWNGMSCALP
jgi:hypothetical protein